MDGNRLSDNFTPVVACDIGLRLADISAGCLCAGYRANHNCVHDSFDVPLAAVLPDIRLAAEIPALVASQPAYFHY